MTLEEAIATQPAWITWWLYWLVLGAVILPLALLIWRESRLTAVIVVAASVIAGFGVEMMYERMGYVKLIGLPHVLLWTPVAIWLWLKLTRGGWRQWPRLIGWVVLATLVISLVFDYTDVARYALGERTPAPGTLTEG